MRKLSLSVAPRSAFCGSDQRRAALRRTGASLAIVAFCAALSMGGCNVIIDPDDDDPFSSRTPLDRVRAEIEINQDADANNATIRMVLRDGFSRLVQLSADQGIEIDGNALASVSTGVFERSLPIADSYSITVREPTRGVETSTITAPGPFGITSPALGGGASLSGFNLTWNGVNATLDVEVQLRQDVLDRVRTTVIEDEPDDGALALVLLDLEDFVQGAPLEIEFSKVASQSSIAGFSSAEVTVRRTIGWSVTPGP